MNQYERALARANRKDELRAWFEQEAKTSLTGETLSDQERAQIAARVRSGRMRQGGFYGATFRRAES
jgi:hypothetical protein